MPQDYNNTLNLPQTEFSMRAALPQKEPAMLSKWQEEKLYEGLMEKNAQKPLYVLHDGPPYANGDIHLGTALNKTLKDIIVRYKNMTGFKAPYVPGWDTHGLPTELKARKKAGVENSSDIDPLELRKLCREFTLGYLDDQRTQFKRLGVIGEWDNPYITLTPEFEAKQIEIFAELATKGYIYKGLKPVYWCSDCQTALAEAEIEYGEDPCQSIYVKFGVKNDKGILSALGANTEKTSFVIWTTTTWTLPGNVAICLGPDFNYAVIKSGGEYFVMAEELYKQAFEAAGITDFEVLATIKGSALEGIVANHPFLERDSLIIVGDHVTLESGTGCVHTAPGHGVDDYEVCKKYKQLPIVVPVDSKGKLTELAGKFAGLSTFKANKAIAEELKETGHLFAVNDIVHQYPHCWRCKKPVLFRATEQWFCSVDGFKEDAVKAIKEVKWIPSWGEDRIISMVTERADWCISRQRKWGVPLPIFYCTECNEALMTRESILSVADAFKKDGSDAWYMYSAEELLPKGTACKCGCQSFTKEKDIMDVWFDSGVSHAAVCDVRENLKWPADLYLEGADQYRGWFQSSLLTSVAWRGTAPYKAVVTHGWVVDGEGKKQSKSLGNGMLPSEIINEYGADILRLWVASSDYHSDIRISKDILKQLSEAYRKIRNTARFILGNLFDFNPDTNSAEEFSELDTWALHKLNDLTQKVTDAYEAFDFYQAFHAMHNFCIVDMSSFYLDIIKDRLYVEKSDSQKRRAAQTVMYKILVDLTKMIAPVLAFSAEEIWSFIPHSINNDSKSVLYNQITKCSDNTLSEKSVQKWDNIIKIREDVLKALELARAEKIIGKSLEAKVLLYAEGNAKEFIESVLSELSEIFIVSQTELKEGKGSFEAAFEGLSIDIVKADGDKCERCWMYSDTVGKNKEHETLCKRCAHILS